MKYWVVYANDVSTIEENGLQNIVKRVHWRRKFVDGVYIVEELGLTDLPSPNGDTFKEYQNLTFEDYCAWLESINNMVELDAKLDESMEKLKNPPVLPKNLPFDNLAIDQNYDNILLNNINATNNINYGTSGTSIG
jgi:hypothetical protein